MQELRGKSKGAKRSSFFFFFNICSFNLAVLGLYAVHSLSVAVESRGYSLLMLHRLLIVVASLVSEHRLYLSWVSVVVAPGLQSLSSVVVGQGLSCPAACGIFPDQGLNRCLLHYKVDS